MACCELTGYPRCNFFSLSATVGIVFCVAGAEMFEGRPGPISAEVAGGFAFPMIVSATSLRSRPASESDRHEVGAEGEVVSVAARIEPRTATGRLNQARAAALMMPDAIPRARPASRRIARDVSASATRLHTPTKTGRRRFNVIPAAPRVTDGEPEICDVMRGASAAASRDHIREFQP